MTKLDETETPAQIKKAHKKHIADVAESGETAIREREQAFAAQGHTRARIASWREDATSNTSLALPAAHQLA
jgi:hypothetical protein